MDRKLALANDHGLVVMMVGLIETPYRYPPAEQVAVLSRYVAARYISFAVIFSPSFDSDIQEAESRAAVNAVRQAAPSSLITMHMGTGVGPHFHAEEWLSFDMYQSGHNGGDARRQSGRAVGMAADLLSLTPRKPIVNGEAIYEGDLGGAYDVRRTAWLSVLSGAVGYTAGINEVYRWEEDATSKMNVPSSGQIALLAAFLRALQWWDLRPAPQRILNQPEDRARLMAFAHTEDKTLGIAYLPENESITLDLANCAPAYAADWISPSTGEWRGGSSVTPSPDTVFSAPDARDWVLLLSAPDSPDADSIKKALDILPRRYRKSTAEISFARNAPVAGLVRKSPGDGEFVPGTYNEVDCIVNENPKRNSYLYIDVDDRLAFRGGPNRMRVEVRLQSGDPLDGLQLQYDAQGPAETANIYRPAPPSLRKQDGTWSLITFVVETPYLGNRQNSGADFRLFLDGRLCRISSLKVAFEHADEDER
jgi:hypothetical protein